jgi:hypothetical protein
MKPRYTYSGDFHDNGKAELSCGLCSNTGLRYHFRLYDMNDLTRELWVGSECILKFAPHDFEEAEGDKRKAIAQTEAHEVMVTLGVLASLTSNRFNFWPAYQTYGHLTPRQMLVLCRVFRDAEEDITTPPKVCLRKQSHQAQYRAFTDTEKALVYPHLSAQQKTRWMFGL